MRAVPEHILVDENSPSYAVACFKSGLLGTRPIDETCDRPPGRRPLEAHLLQRMKCWFEEIQTAQREEGIEFPRGLSNSPDAEELQTVADLAYEEMRREWHYPADLNGQLDWVISPEQVAEDLAPMRGLDERSARRARLYHSLMSVRQMTFAGFCLRETTEKPTHRRSLSGAGVHAGRAHRHFSFLFSEIDADTLTVCEMRLVNELGGKA